MLSQKAAILIGKDREITGEAHSVLWFLIGRLDYENYVYVPQKEIGAELGMARQSVSRAISLLVRKEVIERGPRIGNASVLRLNPSFGWKGSAKTHRKALQERMYATGLSVVASKPVVEPKRISCEPK